MPQSEAYNTFIASMTVDYEKWHDGIGYDLDALKEIKPEERRPLAVMLAEHLRANADWRDIEALAALNERAPLRITLKHKDPDIRLRAAAALTELGEEAGLEDCIVESLKVADVSTGLSRVLALAEEHPSDKVQAAVRAVARDGRSAEARVNAAGLALFLGGKADEPFDWNHRPFFLRFGAEDPKAVLTAYKELCQRLGMNA
jgi:hypothetical protein